MAAGSGALRTLAVVAALIVAVSCGMPPSPPPAASRAGDAPSADPTAANASILRIDELPLVEPDPRNLTAICDPEPDQVDPEAGASTVFCLDGIVLALRAVAKATRGTVSRIYLRRPACAGSPCSPDELNRATIVAWTDTVTIAVRVDSRLDTVSIAQVLGAGLWPATGRYTPPGVDRPALDGAPGSVATRTPYPYCGRATYDSPAEVLACFRDSVLLARPAEMILLTFGTEGGEVLEVYRFDGVGAIARFQRADGGWIEQRGGLILESVEGSWSFYPWGVGEPLE